MFLKSGEWNFYPMSNNFLVTGAAGRLGSLIAANLEKRGSTVVRVDRIASGAVKGLDLASDFREIVSLLHETRFIAVFHCAAVMDSGNPRYQISQNVLMALNITEAIAELPEPQRPLLVNISSAAEIGDPNQSLCDENVLCRPVSSYGISKHCQTELVLAQAKRIGFRVICPRVFNLLPGSPNQPFGSWIEQVKRIKSGEQPPLLVTGSLDIERDFLDEVEAAKIIISLANVPQAYGVVNVGSGKATSFRDIVEVIQAVSGLNISIKQTLDYGKPILRVVADAKRLCQFVGTPPECDIAGTILKMLQVVQ